VLRHVGQQADLVDSQIGEDLTTETDVAEDALIGCGEALGVDAIGVVDAELRRVLRAVDCKSPLRVVQVDEGSATGFGDLAERSIHRCLAVTAG
jgi:hypothetical protein